VSAPLRARVLARLALENGWRSLAELGVLHARTTEHLLQTCPDLRVTAVDTWRQGDSTLDPPPAVKRRSAEDNGYRSYADVNMETAYEWALSLAVRFPRRLQVMRMDTLSAAERVTERSFDAVFVDADHRPEAVLADIRAWLPNIKPGGQVTGHDWDYHHIGALLERVAPTHIKHEGGVWSVPKNEVWA
jgi:hypothetical protein